MPPTLNAVLGPTETDTVVFDVFTATSGTFLASSPNSNATLTFGIEGGTTGSNVVGGATYDVSEVGRYGTLYVDSATGAYTFVPNSDAINALVAPTTTDFIITVSDGTLSADQTFTIAINGINDAAIISGATSGAVVEAGGIANAALDTPNATGMLTDTDVDNTPNTFTAVSSPTASAKGFGTFTMTANGVWAYTIDQANQRGAGTQCRRQADRHLHGDHRRRHRAGCHRHHQRRQRRGNHFRRHGRLGDRGRWRQVRQADRDRHAHRYRRRQHAEHASRRSVARRQAMAATAPSR